MQQYADRPILGQPRAGFLPPLPSLLSPPYVSHLALFLSGITYNGGTGERTAAGSAPSSYSCNGCTVPERKRIRTQIWVLVA